MTTELSGWGRVPWIEAELLAGERLERVSGNAELSRGLGRAYGDAALPTPGGRVASTLLGDRFLSFDDDTGILRAEAGLPLRTLMRTLLPRGWFSPVSPGTQYVTLGGMVASDIHGKNHHVHGTFGRHVRSLRMLTGTGEVLDVSRSSHPDLFAATLGGMGLTGHILEVEVQLERLPTGWIYEESVRLPNLGAVFDALIDASEQWPMTVSWVDVSVQGDALGRGVLMKGRWAEADEAPDGPPAFRDMPTAPDLFPNGLMNPWTIRWMNRVWYWKHGAADRSHVVGPEAFYYMLDLLQEWNRGYGTRGFTQYQCVMPRDLAVYREFIARFQALGGASFVTVFKDCGPEGEGLLSFPKDGVTLAVDIPMGPGVERMVHELNAYVLDHEGRIYLAKDAFTTAEQFARMYPRLDAFQEVRARYDPDRRITSALAKRLMDG